MCLVVWRVYLGSCVHRSMHLSSEAALQRLQYGNQNHTSHVNMVANLNAALGEVLSAGAASNAADAAALAGSSRNQAAADGSTHASMPQAAASGSAFAFSPHDTWEQRSWKQATADRAAREVMQGASWVRDEAMEALQRENKRLQEEALQADSKRSRAEKAAEAAAAAAVAAANTAEHVVRSCDSWDGGGGGGGCDGEGGGDSWQEWPGGEWRWSDAHGWMWRQENTAWYWLHDRACWKRREELYDKRRERRGQYQKYELARKAARNRLSDVEFKRWNDLNDKIDDSVFVEVTE